jgi:hypothetical protein
VEASLGASWVELPLAWLREHDQKAACDEGDLSSGLLMLACGGVIRPGLAWMLTRPNHHLAPVMAETRDPAGFARLREMAEAGPASARKDARLAATRIATLLASKGGVIAGIAVGDCVELADTQRRVQARGVPVSLSDTLTGIDRRDASLVHATGLPDPIEKTDKQYENG